MTARPAQVGKSLGYRRSFQTAGAFVVYTKKKFDADAFLVATAIVERDRQAAGLSHRGPGATV
jgi:hypothetical protein